MSGNFPGEDDTGGDETSPIVSRKALTLIKLRQKLAYLKRQIARLEPRAGVLNSRLDVMKAEQEATMMKIRMVEASLKEHQREDYELLKAKAVAEAALMPSGGGE